MFQVIPLPSVYSVTPKLYQNAREVVLSPWGGRVLRQEY